jgi:3-oxoacyl-[acyl-carrier-protein] synthase-3
MQTICYNELHYRKLGKKMNNITILGTGIAVPKTLVTNKDLESIVDTSDEWITSRTGIKQRFVSQDETTLSLAVTAAKMAMDQARIQPNQIDLVVVATVTGDFIFPSVANGLVQELGLRNVMSFDVNAACAGFVYAWKVVEQFLTNNPKWNALLVGAESLTKYIDWQDRNTCILFGDGAGAFVMGPGNGIILGIDCASKEDPENNLYCLAPKARGLNNEIPKAGMVMMNGREVFKFATTIVPESILKLANSLKLSVDQIDWYVLHQANNRIIETAANRLGTPIEKFIINIERYGNTSSASIPIAFHEAVMDQKIKRGDTVSSVAFGGGLTWGSIIFQY